MKAPRGISLKTREALLSAGCRFVNTNERPRTRRKTAADRLDSTSESEKIVWWDVCQLIRPDITWDEFEVLWREFLRLRRRRNYS
jgi:hypothetical protein